MALLIKNKDSKLSKSKRFQNRSGMQSKRLGKVAKEDARTTLKNVERKPVWKKR